MMIFLTYRQKRQLIALSSRVLLLFLLVINAGCAKEIEGRVIGIADGDTIFIVEKGTNLKMTVRLLDIDAPERQQAFGNRSRQSLSNLCFKTSVRIESPGRDRYDRVLGHVFCNGVDVNAEQVRRGMAWVYSRFLSDESLYKLQDEARAAKRGLWSDGEPEAPWRFRRYNEMVY